MNRGPAPQPIPMRKHCKTCDATYPVSEFRFHPSGGRPGARLIPHYKCKSCEAVNASARYRRSPEAAAKAARARYSAARARYGSRWPGESYLFTGKYGVPQEFSRWAAGVAA